MTTRKRPTMGRPTRAKTGGTERIDLRVTPAEKRAYSAAAAAVGMGLSEWLRELAAIATGREYMGVMERELRKILELNGLLSKEQRK